MATSKSVNMTWDTEPTEIVVRVIDYTARKEDGQYPNWSRRFSTLPELWEALTADGR